MEEVHDFHATDLVSVRHCLLTPQINSPSYLINQTLILCMMLQIFTLWTLLQLERCKEKSAGGALGKTIVFPLKNRLSFFHPLLFPLSAWNAMVIPEGKAEILWQVDRARSWTNLCPY